MSENVTAYDEGKSGLLQVGTVGHCTCQWVLPREHWHTHTGSLTYNNTHYGWSIGLLLKSKF